MNNKIRAMQLVGYNEPLRLNLVDKPKLTASQLLLKIHTVGMNFGDTLLIKGTYQEKPSLPFTIGMEICGTVEAVGNDISNFSIGDRVATYSGFGGLSEYGCFEADQCVLVPDSMSSEDAAAFLVAYGTSHIALERRARLLAGETLLVLGASGGVGLLHLMLPKLTMSHLRVVLLVFRVLYDWFHKRPEMLLHLLMTSNQVPKHTDLLQNSHTRKVLQSRYMLRRDLQLRN